jgi:hypothetical protein
MEASAQMLRFTTLNILKELQMHKQIFLLLTGFLPVFLFSQNITVQFEGTSEQVAFGIKKIKEAVKGQSQLFAANSSSNNNASPLFITIVIDSNKAKQLVEANQWKAMKSFSDQCYSIRLKNEGKTKSFYVLAGGSRGGMYGSLDIAEAIQRNSINQLTESDNVPYLIRRGIKYNIPLDLRTPSYSDPGDAHQQNISNSWDLNFWQSYFDEMAVHRYNVMTWWSLQPFPSMVKVPEFPEVALYDVWRTKEKYDDTYSSRGLNFDRPILFKNVEVGKKITIDEIIVF